MEVKNAAAAMQLNVAATAVENNSSDSNNKNQTKKTAAIVAETKDDKEEESVKLYISPAGLQKSRNFEQISEQDKKMLTSAELEDMMKKIDGLSSQVINGHFTTTDKLGFQNEIKKLTYEINKLSGNGISFENYDNVQLSQKISDLTRKVSESAVYHKSATAMFQVKSQQMTSGLKPVRQSRLDIAI